MQKILFTILTGLACLPAFAQEGNFPQNLASSLISDPSQKLNIGGYATVDMTKPLKGDQRTTATLDVSRMIISTGYRFTDKTQFLAEVEFEHVKELYVEQAFLNHSFSEALSFRAGLMLVPMGIVNEYHEPTTFNGVLRPAVDNLIVPTTWREIGAGFTGNFSDIGIRYQAYLMNGFISYGADGKGTLSASGGLRGGRQRGARAILSSPNYSAKVDYYGIRGLTVGLAGYFGDTQSALYHNIDRSNTALLARADSSVVGIAMVGVDARYSLKGFQARGQFIYGNMSNSGAYNQFAKSDLGSAITGYYLEGGYNVLGLTRSNHQLIPFIRYEHYDTHLSVADGGVRQDKYLVNEYVFGIGWKPAEGAVFKVDVRTRQS